MPTGRCMRISGGTMPGANEGTVFASAQPRLSAELYIRT